MSADQQYVALAVAQSMLDAVSVHERLTCRLIDPAHPNARSELRRIAATKGFGAAGFKYLHVDYRRLIDRLIDALLPRLASRHAVAS